MIAEEGAHDPVGTIRVDGRMGSLAVYTKVGEDEWHALYVDPAGGHHFSPVRLLGELHCGKAPLVFTPPEVTAPQRKSVSADDC